MKTFSKRTQMAAATCLATVLLGLAGTGCQPAKGNDGKITVGKVDTALLLRDDPNYQTLSIDYMKENTDLRAQFMEKGKTAIDPESKRQVQRQYMEAQQKLDKKWMDRTQEFLTSRHEVIRGSAEQVAAKKEIDIVIIDSKEYPTTEWGGVDITQDLSLALTQDGGKPAGSPSPAKQEG